MIYEPAEDSYLLAKHIKDHAKGRVLDVGTGSGIQALEALKYTSDVFAVDINKEAISFCKEKGINASLSDLFSNVSEKFDLIIFNPPYLPLDKREPLDSRLVTTGGKKGFEIIERFLKKVKEHLEKEGEILLVCSSLTGDVESLFKYYNFNFKILERKKIFFEELFVYLLY